MRAGFGQPQEVLKMNAQNGLGAGQGPEYISFAGFRLRHGIAGTGAAGDKKALVAFLHKCYIMRGSCRGRMDSVEHDEI